MIATLILKLRRVFQGMNSRRVADEGHRYLLLSKTVSLKVEIVAEAARLLTHAESLSCLANGLTQSRLYVR